jgi:hypothetical protein
MTTEQRVAVVSTFQPELASLNCGSLNFALFPVAAEYNEWKFPWEAQYLSMPEDMVFPNTFKTLREFCGYFNENQTKQEIAICDRQPDVPVQERPGCYRRFPVVGLLSREAPDADVYPVVDDGRECPGRARGQSLSREGSSGQEERRAGGEDRKVKY